MNTKGLVQKMHDHFINITIRKQHCFKSNQHLTNKENTNANDKNSLMFINVEDGFLSDPLAL